MMVGSRIRAQQGKGAAAAAVEACASALLVNGNDVDCLERKVGFPSLRAEIHVSGRPASVLSNARGKSGGADCKSCECNL